MDLDTLVDRLEAVRVALPDPDDIAAPNARIRQAEANALVNRTHGALHSKRRRLATLEGRIAEREAELQRWAEAEGILQGQLDAARDALPGIEDHRDRSKAERSIAALERDIREIEDGVVVEQGRTICSGTFSAAFERAFGQPGTSLGQHAPAGALRAQVAALEAEAAEVRGNLAHVVAQVEALLAELEAVAA